MIAFIEGGMRLPMDNVTQKEGELVPQKEGVPPKQQKTAKDKGKASSVESKEDQKIGRAHV